MRAKSTPNDYVLSGDTVHLILTDAKGHQTGVAIIDREDLDRVLAYGRWFRSGRTGHRYARSKRGRAFLHRFVMDAPDGMFVDHCNHDPFDCRKENLRLCTHTENMQNRRAAHRQSKSGIRNVSWNPRHEKWEVRIKANKHRYWIGLFETIEEAEKAAIAGRRRLHGAFAS